MPFINKTHLTIVKKRVKRLFPHLRHWKTKYQQKSIDRNWQEHYENEIRAAIETFLTSDNSVSLAEKPALGGSLIEVTNACNLRCPMCGTHLSEKPKSHMDIGVYSKILDRMAEEGIYSCMLHTVGETFIYPWLKEAVSLAHQKGIVVGISTNANFPEKIEAIYREDPEWIDGFRFSIDGASDEVYGRMRTGGELEKVLKSCQWVLDTNKGRHSSKIALTIDCAVSEENAGEMASFFRLFSKYTFPMLIRFGCVNGLAPDAEYFEENKFNFPNLYTHAVPCKMVFNQIYFNNRGEATLCCRDYDDQLVIGSVIDSPIAEIWNSRKAQEIRRLHLGNDEMTISQCRDCFRCRDGVNEALNSFLHYLWYSHRNADDKSWKIKIFDFLSDVNDLYGERIDIDPNKVDKFLKTHLS